MAFFSFSQPCRGRYEIEILREGFKPYKRTGLIIDVNAALGRHNPNDGRTIDEVVVSDPPRCTWRPRVLRWAKLSPARK